MKPNEARFEAEFQPGSLTMRLCCRVIVALASLVSQELFFVVSHHGSKHAIFGEPVFVVHFFKIV